MRLEEKAGAGSVGHEYIGILDPATKDKGKPLEVGTGSTRLCSLEGRFFVMSSSRDKETKEAFAG